MNQYVEREIHYTDDGRLMDGSYAIMMDWEKPVMEFQAEGGYPAAAPCTDRGYHQVRGFTHMCILCVYITGGVHG